VGCFPEKLGMLSPGDKEVKTPSPNPGQAPRNVVIYSRTAKWDTKAFSGSNVY
jgi:hypothetical protein